MGRDRKSVRKIWEEIAFIDKKEEDIQKQL